MSPWFSRKRSSATPVAADSQVNEVQAPTRAEVEVDEVVVLESQPQLESEPQAESVTAAATEPDPDPVVVREPVASYAADSGRTPYGGELEDIPPGLGSSW